MIRKPLLFLAACGAAFAQSANWTLEFGNHYRVTPNITYVTANNYESKLDLYERRDATGPQPTLIYIHGGGWTGGSKDSSLASLLPWLEMGWNVVNVEYRLARVSGAPAAVEDCLCALRWVAANAAQHHIDTSRIVTSGNSAGGHLALTTAMIPEGSGLDNECPGVPLPKVAAVVDWYGITDVNDLLEGANRKAYAVQWLGSAPDRAEIAKRVSPLNYVRAGLMPILMIQGDADPVVPYQHSVRLKAALDKAGDKNELHTVPGGKHGNFSAPENVAAWGVVREFLKRNGQPAS